MQVALTVKSRNKKVGPIPVSTSSNKTCPDSCPFKGNGCYADAGPLAMFWRKVTACDAGTGWKGFLNRIEELPEGQLWRHNQAGDLPGEGDALDLQGLAELAKANAGKRGFTYTHKPLRNRAERNAIRAANKAGFTINLSANNLEHADKLADLNIGPVVTVLPVDQMSNTITPLGRKVVVCPAVIKDDVSCASCQLCQRARRNIIVGFPAHGASKRKAETASATFSE